MQRADGAPQQILHRGHERVGVDRLRVEGLAAREGEQAVGERGGPLGRAHGGLGVALDVLGAALGDAGLHEVEGADDAGEQVVEVVGDAARELAHRLHLLRLAQLILQELALRDVTADPIDDVRLRGQGPVDPSIRPVPGPQAQVEIGDTPSGPKGREGVLQCRAILGMNQGIEPDPDGFLRRIAQKAAPGRIGFAQDPLPVAGGEEVPGQAPDPIPFPCALLDTLLEGFVEGSQVLLGAFRLGDVVDDADEAQAVRLGVLDMFAPPRQPTDRAVVGAGDPRLEGRDALTSARMHASREGGRPGGPAR